LLHGTILVQEQERKRIAENLHDDIGSKLNALSLYMNQLVEGQSTAKELLPDMKEIIKATAESTRSISHELLPPTLENFGLVEAVKELCQTYDKSKDLQVHFSVEEDKGRLDSPITEMNLFRIVQELISNSTRHGKADEISIQLWQGEEQIQLHYRDNGIGFDVQKIKAQKGLGMKNIYSRLNMMQASMEVESKQDEGAQFYIALKR
ncbi:MAG: ATP-binding protein, partial [Bacteroidota bacterium]